MVKTIGIDNFGWYAEVYEDDDDDSGYGDEARVGRWYGSREACEAVDPKEVDLYPVLHEPAQKWSDYHEDERIRQAYDEDFGWQDESHMNDALDEFMLGLDR